MVFKENQKDYFQRKKTHSYPNVFVNLIHNHRIGHVEKNQIKENPDQGVDNFNQVYQSVNSITSAMIVILGLV